MQTGNIVPKNGTIIPGRSKRRAQAYITEHVPVLSIKCDGRRKAAAISPGKRH